MRFSQFGQRYSGDTGTRRLMDDLGEVLSAPEPLLNLGGGNPAVIPEMQAKYRALFRALVEHDEFDDVIAKYDSPQGNRPFLNALSALLNERFGWALSAENIATTAGSQASFFMLFNMLAGRTENGERLRILLPLAPEYIGYSDVGLYPDMVTSQMASIDIIDEHTFKYRIDFDHLHVDPDIAAVCVSRPTNPTGNVITDDELRSLIALTRSYDIPLIIDNAYGLPFPNIVFTEAEPLWSDNVILCMSLSKLGLPGLRTGIVIGPPELIQAISSMNAIFMLANGSLGASLARPLIESGEIVGLSERIIKPFYARRSAQALAWCHECFAGLDYYVHVSEGAIFLWLWFPGLPIDDTELYRRLKQRRVLVLAGSYFFPGLEETTRHVNECLRVSYAQEPDTVYQGLRIIGEEVRKAFDEGG
jgi:valine--pyruvate aminotransferase